MNYVSEFLRLKCATDVLRVVGDCPRLEEKIQRAMATLKAVRGVFLQAPWMVTLLDINSGNALWPILAAHVLPVRGVLALDKKPLNRDWGKVRRFGYRPGNLITHLDSAKKLLSSYPNTVLTCLNPRGDLPNALIELYNHRGAGLVVFPNFISQPRQKLHPIAEEGLGDYVAGALSLAQDVDGDLKVEAGITYPRNLMVTSFRVKK